MEAIGAPDVVQFLLENGASVDMTDNNSETALIQAAYADHVDDVKTLLKRRGN